MVVRFASFAIVGVVIVGEVASTTLPDPVTLAAEIAVPFPLKIPVTVVVNVNAGVAPPDEDPAKPFAVATDTAVTPEPAGVPHVPSPLQKVEEEAEVPEFRCVTPRFPVTSELAKSTAEEESNPAELRWPIPVP